MYLLFRPEDGAGDGVVDPVVDAPVDPVVEKPVDDSQVVVDAEKEYRARMEALGGKYDTEGSFIGFDIGESGPVITNQGGDDGDLDAKLAGLESRIVTGLKPERVAGSVTRVLANNPGLKPYQKVVESLLEKSDPAQINDTFTLSMFYFARGQATDVEIAKARKEERELAKKEREKVDAGGAAISEGGGGKQTAPAGKGKITPQIEEYAKAWKLDPQGLADKLAAAKEKK